MKVKFFFFAACTAGFLMIAGPAEAACCQDHPPDIDIVSMMVTGDPQLTPAPPARQTAEVWFMRPVWVGRSILQGRYVIEHDYDRMARGEPCTHIYAFDKRDIPVKSFYCTHLDRDHTDRNIVVLTSTSDGMQRLTEFQFAGEIASHGYPTGR